MWNIVWVSPQGCRSVFICRHFLLQALQCPCSVWKWLSRDHCCRGRSKPGCRIVGSHTRWELTTWADFQSCLHRLLMSTGCISSHSGFLDVSRSNGGLRISVETNLIQDFTAVTFSVKLAFFCEKRPFPWNLSNSVKSDFSWILTLLLSFMKVFRVLSTASVQILLFATCHSALSSWHVFTVLLTYIQCWVLT